MVLLIPFKFQFPTFSVRQNQNHHKYLLAGICFNGVFLANDCLNIEINHSLHKNQCISTSLLMKHFADYDTKLTCDSRHPQSLGQGNVFTLACHSVYGGRGSASWGLHPGGLSPAGSAYRKGSVYRRFCIQGDQTEPSPPS